MSRPDQPLEDVADITTYCASIVRERWHRLPDDLREELELEAVCIAYELHRNKWRPDDCASFRAYLSTYLPLRLVDWWRTHRRQVGGLEQDDGTYADPTLTADLSDDAGDLGASDSRLRTEPSPGGVLFDPELTP